MQHFREWIIWTFNRSQSRTITYTCWDSKKCSASLDHPTWHTQADNYNTTPIACKISQTQYSFQRLHFEHINICMNIYKYILKIYMISKTMQSILCYIISMQCFIPYITNIYQYKFYFIRFIILTSYNTNGNNRWYHTEKYSHSRYYIM